MLRSLIAGGWLTALVLGGLSAPAAAQSLRTSTPSGEPVPRYMSLRFDEVNGRRGPGFDYQISWLYLRAALPVQVVAETETWRKVRDPQGDEVWMHRRTLARKRTVLSLGAADGGPLALHEAAGELSAIAAQAEAGVIFALDQCDGDWCRVDGAQGGGWAPMVRLWGVDARDGGAADPAASDSSDQDERSRSDDPAIAQAPHRDNASGPRIIRAATSRAR